MIRIDKYELTSRAVLAPMAGISDLPFRQLCRQLGAGAVTAEMTTSNPKLRHTLKSRMRLADQRSPEPRIVQIVGTEATQMAEAAVYQVEHGAQIIDINMGCPAKKVCKKAAGSALLKDEKNVADILNAVVASVPVPVTLKIRTGWDTENRNGVSIARIAEDCGIKSLAVHGRTRACRFNGHAEYDTIAEIVQAVSIPVLANGDIRCAEDVKTVLDYTAADGVMLGRAAQGNPWIFMQINDLLENEQQKQERNSYFLSSNGRAREPGKNRFTASPICAKINQKKTVRILGLGADDTHRAKCGDKPYLSRKWRANVIKLHMRKIHRYYSDFGPNLDVKIARKHANWYIANAWQLAAGATTCSTIDRMPGEQSANGSVETAQPVLHGQRANRKRVKHNQRSDWQQDYREVQKQFNRLCSTAEQLAFIDEYFGKLHTGETAA